MPFSLSSREQCKKTVVDEIWVIETPNKQYVTMVTMELIILMKLPTITLEMYVHFT